MSFTYNDELFVPKTAIEHAQQMLTVINNVRQSLGQSLLTPTTNNIVWLFLLAAGSRNAEVDQEMNTGFDSLNPSLCDDDQILNIVPMVGTQRVPATYSTAIIEVVPTTIGAPITIPAGSQLAFGDVFFETDEIYSNISAPATISINVTCTVSGAVVCPADSLTSFNLSITNVASVTNPLDGAIGSAEESIASLRRRIILGDVVNFGVNAAIRAIRSLQGITQCNVFFNPSEVDDLILPPGITVPPRNSYIVIVGYSSGIAQAYFETMNCATIGDESQQYITLAGQSIPVYYNIATEQEIFVQVWYDEDAEFQVGFETVIAETIMATALTIPIGQEVTAQYFSEALSNFQLATITGVEVSSDGYVWARFITIDANKYATVPTANTTVSPE